MSHMAGQSPPMSAVPGKRACISMMPPVKQNLFHDYDIFYFAFHVQTSTKHTLLKAVGKEKCKIFQATHHIVLVNFEVLDPQNRPENGKMHNCTTITVMIPLPVFGHMFVMEAWP